MFALRQLSEYYEQARGDPEFQKQFDNYMTCSTWSRPCPLYFAERLTKEAGGARIFLKREDLNHTGAHKINNCIGQALLTRRDGRVAHHRRNRRGPAWRGDGNGGGAAVRPEMLRFTWAKRMCAEQKLNVFKMKARWGPRLSPSPAAAEPCVMPSMKPCNDWMATVENTHYIIGSVVGPHPFPAMVRDFQSIIGQETRPPMPSPGKWAGCRTL